MAIDYSQKPIDWVRRKDREVQDESWMKAFLHEAHWGSMALITDGKPFIHVNLFVFDEEGDSIYFHTAREGRTRWSLEPASEVVFNVSEMGRLLPAKRARNFSVEYKSLTLYGVVRVIEDATEAKKGLQALLDKYCPHLKPGEDYQAITTNEMDATTSYCMDIKKWTGKQKKVDEDFPGAFFYGFPPGDALT